MTFPTPISSSQANKETPIGEDFTALHAASVYGFKAATSSGLVAGYHGNVPLAVADGTYTCSASSTNYVVANRATGAVTVATNTTNWDNTSTYGRVRKHTTSASAITATEDWRSQPGGIFDYGGVGTAAPAFSATPTIDTTAAEVIYFGALTANVTAFNLSGTRPKVIVCFVQDATGGRTVTAGTSIDFGTGSGLTNLSGIASAPSAYTYCGFVYNPTTAKFRLVAISS